MGKILRLGFALGGGVSLGSYCGAALSEAIKLAVLYGKDRNGERFDRVEVDVFAGASAGAMSLGLMIRALAQPDPGSREEAITKLRNDHGAAFTELPPSRREEAIAAQSLQFLEKRVWVDEVNFDLLTDKSGDDMLHTAGLLGRRHLETIANRFFSFPQHFQREQSILLGNRVVFCTSLTNLTPILHDVRKRFDVADALEPALGDGMTSFRHKDRRVFDLRFRDEADDVVGSDRWLRYGKDMAEDDLWRELAATCIASGTFPLAFEPTVLKRNANEYGDLWPDELTTDTHDFTFVDGGVFNNEPIREAIRIAAHVDATIPQEEFERVIVFVDPFIDPVNTSFRVDSHATRFSEPPPNLNVTLDGFDIKKMTSGDRLISVVKELFRAMFHEGRFISADEDDLLLKRFALRDVLREHLTLAGIDVDDNRLEKLRSRLGLALTQAKRNDMLPAIALSVDDEMQRASLRYDYDIHSKEGMYQALMASLLDQAVGVETTPTPRLIPLGPMRIVGNDVQAVHLPGGALSGFAGFMSPLAGEHEVEVAIALTREQLKQADFLVDLPQLPIPEFESKEKEFNEKVREGKDKLGDRVKDVIKQSRLMERSAFGGIVRNKIGSLVDGLIEDIDISGKVSQTFELRVVCLDDDFELNSNGFYGDIKVEMIKGWPILPVLCNWIVERGKAFSEGRWEGPAVTQHQYLIVERNRAIADRNYAKIELPTATQLEEARLRPWPIFVLKLKYADDGAGWDGRPSVPSSRWERPMDEVIPLADQLRIVMGD